MILRDEYGFNEDLTMWEHGNPNNMISISNGHRSGFNTLVEIKDKATGEVLFRGKNKTMLAGSEFMAMRTFKIKGASFTTPTYNTQLGLESTKVSTGNDLTLAYTCNLFCIGQGGCNRESAIFYPVNNKTWIDTTEIIPFQMVPSNKDLTPDERKIYFGRKPITNLNMVAYYFKRFEGEPVLKKQFDDGTPWSSSVYQDKSTLKAQVIVTNTLSVTKYDGRDYFIHSSGINDGRFNSLELCTSWGEVVNGYTYFQDIRPITRINFPNKYLNDLTAGWDISYTIYF